MLLVKQFDDSSLEKIRKTIFIFCSICLFVVFYRLTINMSGTTFIGIDGKIIITYKQILWFIIIIQMYLLIRLIILWKISKAIFEKNWIHEEFTNEKDIEKLRNELKNFHQYFLNNSINDIQKNLDVEQYVNSVLDELKELMKLYGKAIINFNAYNESTFALNKIIKENKNQLNDILILESEDFNKFKLEMEKAKREIEMVPTHLSHSTNTLIDYVHKVVKLNIMHEKFLHLYPESHYKLTLETKESNLLKARKTKVWDLYIFDLVVPLIIGITTIIISIYCILNF